MPVFILGEGNADNILSPCAPHKSEREVPHASVKYIKGSGERWVSLRSTVVWLAKSAIVTVTVQQTATLSGGESSPVASFSSTLRASRGGVSD